MAKRAARLQTAYDLGHEHGRTGSKPRDADQVIGDDPDMQQAYDEGLVAGTDSVDAPDPTDPKHHADNPPATDDDRRGGRKAGKSGGRGPAGQNGPPGRPAGGGGKSGQRFSHPLHWGSGSRGHVVGKPTLRPPRHFSMADGTGFFFGLLAYSLGLAYLRNGPRGITGWLSAKFLNVPYPDFKAKADADRAAHGPKVGVTSQGGTSSTTPGTGGGGSTARPEAG